MNTLHSRLNQASWLNDAVVVGIAVTALAAGCANSNGLNNLVEPTGPTQVLILTGSSTMTPLMRAIGDRYQGYHPDVEVRVSMGGSGKGIQDARSGTADIGMASRALNEKEKDLLGFPVARDAICLLVHRDNPIRELTQAQTVAVYTGRVVNWKDLGGRDAPIRVLGRTHGRGEVEIFTHYLKIQDKDLRTAEDIGDNQAGIKAIAADPNAVVYISLGMAEAEANAGAAIKLLPVDGVQATSRNVRSGYFPMSRPLTLVTRTVPEGTARAFIDFATSSQVTDLIRQHNFVPYLD